MRSINNKVLLPPGNRAMREAILFGVKFANDIHYKLRCGQASIKQGFGTPKVLAQNRD